MNVQIDMTDPDVRDANALIDYALETLYGAALALAQAHDAPRYAGHPIRRVVCTLTMPLRIRVAVAVVDRTGEPVAKLFDAEVDDALPRTNLLRLAAIAAHALVMGRSGVAADGDQLVGWLIRRVTVDVTTEGAEVSLHALENEDSTESVRLLRVSIDREGIR
jgi:hypothetical protein